MFIIPQEARVEWLNDDQLRIGNIVLGHLPEGCWRHLGPDERF